MKSFNKLIFFKRKSIKNLKFAYFEFGPIIPGYFKLSSIIFSILNIDSFDSFWIISILESKDNILSSVFDLNDWNEFIFSDISELSVTKLLTRIIFEFIISNFFSHASYWSLLLTLCSVNFIFNFSSIFLRSFNMSFLKNNKSCFILLFSGLNIWWFVKLFFEVLWDFDLGDDLFAFFIFIIY